VLIAPEHAAVADVLETVLIDHDRDKVRVDLERGNKGTCELFDDPAFLFRGPAFAHLENNDGHLSYLLDLFRLDVRIFSRTRWPAFTFVPQTESLYMQVLIV